VTQPATGQLHVSAGLVLEVDGQAVQISGSGQDIVVSAPDASGLAQHLRDTAAALDGRVGGSRRAMRRLADAANRAGLRVEIVGRTGPVAAIGRDVHVPGMRWLAGSPHVSIKPGRESLSALAAILRPRRLHNAVTRRRRP
jgi:hypothetical protein